MDHLRLLLNIPHTLLGEDLAAQIEHGQRARDPNRLADSDEGQVPAGNQAEEAEATGYFEEVSGVRCVRGGGDVRD